MDDSPFLRPMTAAEVEQLVDWAALEGWNPGLSDAQAFYTADPDGYLAAEVRGEFVAGGAIVRHHANFGFMGLFIVRPDHRGKGLGRILWYARRDRLATRLAPGGTIGMDAVEAMRAVPSVVLINLGENGVPAGRDVTEALGTLRRRVEPATKIIVMLPLSGRGRAEISRAFEAYKAAARDDNAWLIDLGQVSYATADGQHPTAAGHRAIFEAALPAFNAILGRGSNQLNDSLPEGIGP